MLTAICAWSSGSSCSACYRVLFIRHPLGRHQVALGLLRDSQKALQGANDQVLEWIRAATTTSLLWATEAVALLGGGQRNQLTVLAVDLTWPSRSAPAIRGVLQSPFPSTRPQGSAARVAGRWHINYLLRSLASWRQNRTRNRAENQLGSRSPRRGQLIAV